MCPTWRLAGTAAAGRAGAWLQGLCALPELVGPLLPCQPAPHALPSVLASGFGTGFFGVQARQRCLSSCCRGAKEGEVTATTWRLQWTLGLLQTRATPRQMHELTVLNGQAPPAKAAQQEGPHGPQQCGPGCWQQAPSCWPVQLQWGRVDDAGLIQRLENMLVVGQVCAEEPYLSFSLLLHLPVISPPVDQRAAHEHQEPACTHVSGLVS